MSPTFRSIAVVLSTLALFAPTTAAAQRKNDPAQCPYCKGDPELMKKAGIVSHGGFDFGNVDTTSKVDGLLATCDIKWIETAHFEVGFALGEMKVKQEEKAKIRAELGRLQEVLPAVDPKTKILDPWLRTHLYAQRVEDAWKRMLAVLQVKESDFPPEPVKWNLQGKYMGNGPFLGQEHKYELLIVPTEANLTSYLQTHFGLLTKKTQRWNLPGKDTLSITIHCQEDNLRDDEGLHAHVVFNTTINLLDGFKHYSYDTPIWIREGLAHVLEREVSQKYNSFDAAEGSLAATTRKEKWEPEVRKLVAAGKAPRMAEMMSMKEYSDLTLDRHFAAWSMVDFLLKTKPEGFAKLNDGLHGRVNSQGIPDAQNLGDTHRDLFKEVLGWSYPEFDAAWSEWVTANYGRAAPEPATPPVLR